MTKEEILKVSNNAGIYFIRNKINSKYYIGQSIKLRQRLLKHLVIFKSKRCNAPLYKAFEKYSLDNFEFGILKEIEGTDYTAIKRELDILEIKYIEEYNSYGATGYNQTLGGDAGILGYKMSPEVIDKFKKTDHSFDYKMTYLYNIKDKYYLVAISITHASKISGVIRSSLSKACRGVYRTSGNFIGAFSKEELESKILDYKNNPQEYKNKGLFINGHNRTTGVSHNRPILSLAHKENISDGLKEYWKIKNL